MSLLHEGVYFHKSLLRPFKATIRALGDLYNIDVAVEVALQLGLNISMEKFPEALKQLMQRMRRTKGLSRILLKALICFKALSLPPI